MGHFVNAPLVVARLENGSHVYLYHGAPVPSNVHKDEVKRLHADGMLTSDEAEAAQEDAPQGSAPAKSAPKEEWVAYAESKGDVSASDKTKEQLVSDHG